MKTFARHKTFDEVAAQCKAQGVRFDAYQYRVNGADTIVVGGPLVLPYKKGSPAYVVYNTTNGRFSGRTHKGLTFSESSDFDDRPWFQALLAFFYVEKEPAAAPAPATTQEAVPA